MSEFINTTTKQLKEKCNNNCQVKVHLQVFETFKSRKRAVKLSNKNSFKAKSWWNKSLRSLFLQSTIETQQTERWSLTLVLFPEIGESKPVKNGTVTSVCLIKDKSAIKHETAERVVIDSVGFTYSVSDMVTVDFTPEGKKTESLVCWHGWNSSTETVWIWKGREFKTDRDSCPAA